MRKLKEVRTFFYVKGEMVMMFRPAAASFFIVLVLSFIGCGGEVIPPLGQVDGLVTDQSGTPLDGVTVMFLPDPEEGNFGQPGIGKTDAEGKFVLFYDGDPKRPGTALGKNRVILRDDKAIETERDENPMRRRFNKKYVNSFSTDLSFVVKNGEAQSFEIKVSK